MDNRKVDKIKLGAKINLKLRDDKPVNKCAAGDFISQGNGFQAVVDRVQGTPAGTELLYTVTRVSGNMVPDYFTALKCSNERQGTIEQHQIMKIKIEGGEDVTALARGGYFNHGADTKMRSNNQEMLNDAWGSYKPVQINGALGQPYSDPRRDGLPSDPVYFTWIAQTQYASGARVAFDGKCFVASGAAIPVGRGPSVHAASPFWTEVLCPRARGQNNYIYDPFDDAGKVNAPDFACRLPAVFWKRNAAVRFDSPVHDTFRFKVRGCFLHEASFYSATAEQRTCAVGTDEAKAKTVGFKTKAEMAPTIEDAAEGEPTTLVEERLGMGVVTSTAADVDAVGSSARLILADLMVSAADGKSFFDVADFNKVARAKLQHSLSKSLGVAAMHVLIESVSQEGKKGMVTMAFLSNADGAKAMKLKLADAAVAVQEILGGDLTSKIEFANTRDMLEYAGAKTILSTSVTLLVGDGNTAEALTSSSALRVEFQRVIAETLGVAISAVRITGVESAAKSRRLNQAGRGLTEGGSAIILSFTVVTEPSADADLTTEGMTASLQGT